MNIEVSEEDSNYMYSFIQRIIDECGPRMPCSPQEAQGAEIIKNELEETCDNVEIEHFKCHPRAALGWIRIVIFITLASFSIFFLIQLFLDSYWVLILSILPLALMFLAILIAWEEFFCYKEFIDPLFKEKESQNVIGKIKPKKEIKKIIIFSGHHDSALEFNLLKYLKYGYPIVIFIGLGILFIWFLASIVFFFLTLITFSINLAVIYEFFFNLVIWLFIIGAIPLIMLLFFVTPGERANRVPGAVDNLSAVSIILGIGRYLKNHKDIIPENTEIRLISFGCEEAFLRGAYRYVKAHLTELKTYKTECINLDAIQSRADITFSNKEPTTRTIHSEEIVQKLINAAELVNIEAKTTSLGGGSLLEKIIGQIGGGTDAAAFSKSKIKASTITGVNLLKMLQFYHQDTDTLDKIEPGVLENTLKICIGYVLNESKTK